MLYSFRWHQSLISKTVWLRQMPVVKIIAKQRRSLTHLCIRSAIIRQELLELTYRQHRQRPQSPLVFFRSCRISARCQLYLPAFLIVSRSIFFIGIKAAVTASAFLRVSHHFIQNPWDDLPCDTKFVCAPPALFCFRNG